jgi:hypothetical protein
MWQEIACSPKRRPNDIEIGSYGMREYENFKWIYGTGMAEPRFSKARK